MALKDAAGNETFHRIAAVAQLHLQGWGVPGIAREVGCCQSQVWHDIKMLREFWVDQANQTFAIRQGEELARIAQVEAAAWEKGDLRTVLRCIEMRLKMFKMIGPSVVVQQNVQVNWDAVQGAADTPVPDVIEERLARESIPHLEAKLNGYRSREDGGAGEAAGGR
jgi:hypothetical protein